MMVIWKYTISGLNPIISMPAGARILTAQAQGSDFVLWAMVDPSQAPWPRRIEVWGTGWEMPDAPRVYIGTVQDPNSGLVFHIFEQP